MFSAMFPRNDQFFDYFNDMAGNVKRGGQLMRDLCQNRDRREELVGAIREMEHASDKTSREIQKLLIRSFITPLDREDIHQLTSSLDDVIDFIDEAATSFILFQVSEPIPDYVKQVDLMANAINYMVEAISQIRHPKNRIKCRSLLYKIYDLESEGDAVFNHALAKLFSEEKDPMTVLKWKELCDDIEGALDACQAVANTLEMIILKTA
jgi:predicted phosphate transport protein (TIGR00153 family)